MTEHLEFDPRALAEAVLSGVDPAPPQEQLDFHLRLAVQDTQLAAARRQVALESATRQLLVLESFIGHQLELIGRLSDDKDYASGCGTGHGTLQALDTMITALHHELRIARDRDGASGNS